MLGQVVQGRLEVIPIKPVDLSKVVVKGAYLLEAQMTKGEGEDEE
jgi:hypothetical protein